MIDIHSHVIYGVDDGAATLDQSLQMLEMAAASGTTDIVATPHANSEFPYRREVVEERLAQLKAGVSAKIRIHLGCDLHLSFQNIQDALADRSRYSINGKGYVLVEFSDVAIPPNSGVIFREMMNRGLTPIITHPERNGVLQKRLDDLERWVQGGCLVQVTAQSFSGGFGREAKQCADRLLERNLIHFVASDAHDPEHRPPRLDEAYTYVCRKEGRERADQLFNEYPRCVIDGEPLYLEEYVATKRNRFRFW